MLEAEYTKMLLDVLAEKEKESQGSATQHWTESEEFIQLQAAFNKVRQEPDSVLGNQYFQENFPQFIMAFYCANLPCSAKKYAKMNELRDRAFAFLTTSSIGKSWETS